MFHEIEGLNSQEEIGKNVRVFEGDGTPFLPVPGLMKVSGVRIGSVVIPLEETRRIPADGSLLTIVDQKIPMIDLVGTGAGAILRRGKLSNDGIWQAKSKIYVAGEWEEEKAKEPTSTAGKK